jgi:pimeloyl-ACP methyl ester carboxylesterase
MWESFTEDQRADLESKGSVAIGNDYDDGQDYIVTRKLIEDGRKYLLLRDKIALTCPVRLVHGLQDADVPWATSQKISGCLQSADVETTFVKNGDHRLSIPSDLDRLQRILDALLQTVKIP